MVGHELLTSISLIYAGAAFVATFAMISVNPEVALLASILYGILNLIATTVGGLIALFIGKKISFGKKL